MIVDTHCHLAAEDFDRDRDEAIARAAVCGVERIVVVGTDPESSRKSLAIARAHPGFAATGGVHPHDASRFLAEGAWEALESLVAGGGFSAIGETGLDYFYRRSPKEAQLEALRRQIALSRRLRLPLVLHCREAAGDLIDAIDREGRGEAFGVVHCFTGTSEEATEFVARGFYISFSGILTFPSAETLRAASRVVPRDRLLVETDAPFLAPVPHRGKRNEPAFVRETLRWLAEGRGEGESELAEATSKNAARLFGLA